MTDIFYRFICDKVGIYEAVNTQCPMEDTRRSLKPDGSWLPKVGADYPGAISFWKKVGLEKYENSRLRDWHLSVTTGHHEIVYAKNPKNILYEDDLQIILDRSDIECFKFQTIIYNGPSSDFNISSDDRPSMIRHHSSLRDWVSYAYYAESNETFVTGASLGSSLGLQRIAVHHEILKPGKRSSFPHAHSIEEELCYILSGSLDVWINGTITKASKGDTVYFPPGTNLAHSLINSSDAEASFLMFGEQNQENDKIYYPLNPERNNDCSKNGTLWDEKPDREILNNHKQYDHIVSLNLVKANELGSISSSSRIYYKDKNISEHLDTKRIAIHHVTLPTGCRSSLPHAESHEEEFIYVLKGSVILWLDGHRYELNVGDSVAFPSGTGICHTFINESGTDAELIVSGERTKKENLCYFPLHPEQKDSCDIWWDNAPIRKFGNHSDMPKRSGDSL